MEEKTLKEVCEEYRLSDDERKRIGNVINSFMMFGKTPQQNPIAVIDIAPPGSGKTGLNGLALEELNNNAVVINSDELKPFRPNIDELAKKYPEYYTKVTNQESNPWTDDLFDKAVGKRLNIIFEGTGRNLKLLFKRIQSLKGYKIIVRGMAVNELNCLMSIIERYEGQVKEKGWGRLVTKEHFYKAYEEMPDTIEQVEKSGLVDSVEVYTRSNEPSKPKLIYSTRLRTFQNARQAVNDGRNMDKKAAVRNHESFLFSRPKEKVQLREKREIFDKIEKLAVQNSENEIEI